MEKPRAPYRELTDPANQDILATLNPRLWAAFQRARARALFFEVDIGVEFLEAAYRQTGSLEAGHRADLKEALMGQKPPTVALGAPSGQPNGAREAKSLL